MSRTPQIATERLGSSASWVKSSSTDNLQYTQPFPNARIAKALRPPRILLTRRFDLPRQLAPKGRPEFGGQPSASIHIARPGRRQCPRKQLGSFPDPIVGQKQVNVERLHQLPALKPLQQAFHHRCGPRRGLTRPGDVTHKEAAQPKASQRTGLHLHLPDPLGHVRYELAGVGPLLETKPLTLH